MLTDVSVLQFDGVFGLLENAGFLWALLIGTWGALSYSFLRRHRNGPKVGPTQVSGTTSFGLTKPRMSEEEIFRILTTTEVNIQIVRICETPRSAREIARGLGEVYPGHKEKGFPPDKGGERCGREDGQEILRLDTKTDWIRRTVSFYRGDLSQRARLCRGNFFISKS